MKSAFLSFFAFFGLCAINAQPYLLEEIPNLKNHSQEIRAMAETSTGEFWVACNKGVYQKGPGGYQYHAVDSTTNTAGGYTPITINTLAYVQNTIWVGTENKGAYFWQNGTWNQVDTASGLPNNKVNALAEDDSGNVWIATVNGLGQFSSSNIVNQHFPYPSNNNILSLAYADGKLYVSNNTVSDPNKYYNAVSWTTLPSYGFGTGPDRATKLSFNQHGNLIALSRFGSELFLLKNGSWHKLGNDRYADFADGPSGIVALSRSGNNFSILKQDTLSGLQNLNLEPSFSLDLMQSAQSNGFWLAGQDNGHPVVLYFNPQPHAYAQLDVNDLIAGFYSGGDLFQNPTSFDFDERNSRLNLFHPDSASMVYTGHLWLGHQQDVSANAYGQSGRDFMSGPISSSYDAQYLEKYDRVWKVSKSQIQNHRDSTYHGDYSMPHGIAHWPAHGDPSRGEAANLAPFVDYNANGKYEPELGDHPNIKGDEAVYFIFNDMRWKHSETHSNRLGVEVHGMAYAYDTTDASLQKTIFLSYKIFNRSGQTFNDFKSGLWLDFDLGNPLDDLTASDSAADLIYVYNGDNYDEGFGGFGANPPSLGLVSLSNNLQGALSFYSSASPGIPAAITSPQTASEYSNCLQSRWKDGSPIYIEKPNGDGYSQSPGSLPITNFHLNDNVGWTPAPTSAGEFKSLAVFNSSTLPSGDAQCIEMALVYGRSQGGIFASASQMKSNVQSVKQFYQQSGNTCLETVISVEEESLNERIHIYPNPVSTFLNLRFNHRVQLLEIDIFTMAGQKVMSTTAKTTIDVSTLKPGIYLISGRSSSGQFSERFIKQ